MHAPWFVQIRFLNYHACPGDLKRNATVVGLAIKHCGLRPSLPMFEQASSQFFALALPRGMESCSPWDTKPFMSRKQWGVARVTSLGVGAKPDIRGIRAKAHAKIAMRMVYAFSRIAKQPAYMCKPYITSCMTIKAACHKLQLQGAHTDLDAPRSARSISSLVCPCQDLGS